MDCRLHRLCKRNGLQSHYSASVCPGVLQRHRDILPGFGRLHECECQLFCHQRPTSPHRIDRFLPLPAFNYIAPVRARAFVCSAAALVTIYPAQSFTSLQKWSYCETNFHSCNLLIFVYDCIQIRIASIKRWFVHFCLDLYVSQACLILVQDKKTYLIVKRNMS